MRSVFSFCEVVECFSLSFCFCVHGARFEARFCFSNVWSYRFCDMVSFLLIGDNNLSRFWPAYQFSRPNLKHASLLTATDFDTLDHALTQAEEKDQVIISVLTSLLIDEVNQLEVESSALNVCEQAVSRLVGFCPQSPSCQVSLSLFFSICCSFLIDCL